MNLRELINTLPRTIANRYSDDVWLSWANATLGDISDRGVFPWSTRSAYVPFDKDLMAIELAPSVRSVLGVFDQAGAGLPYRVEGLSLSFSEGTFADSDSSYDATVTASLGEIQTRIDLGAHDSVVGYAMHKQGFQGVLIKYDRVISPTLAEIGHSSGRFVVNDDVSLYARWVQIVHTAGFETMTDPFATIYSAGNVLDETLRLGLWYRAVRQVDESGEGARERLAEFTESIDRFFATNTRRAFRQQPKFGFSTKRK